MKKMNIVLFLALMYIVSCSGMMNSVQQPFKSVGFSHIDRSKSYCSIKGDTVYVNLSHMGLTDISELASILKMQLDMLLSENPSLRATHNGNFDTALFDLDLSHNALETFTVSDIQHLHGVARLNLSHNRLKTLPSNFPKLASLTNLDLSNNAFIELPFIIGSLPSLNELNLVGNSFNKEATDSFKNFFEALPHIHIVHYAMANEDHAQTPFAHLSDIPQAIINGRFTGHKLDLSKLGLTNIDGIDQLTLPNSDGTELVSLEDVEDVTIDLSKNNLKALPASFSNITPKCIDLSFNHFKEFPSVILDLLPEANCELGGGLSINLSHNMITVLPDDIDSLKLAENFNDYNLNLSFNRLRTLPESLFQIGANSIDVSHNEIETLPEITDFSSIDINLSHNRLKTLPKSFCDQVGYDLDLSHNEFETLPEAVGLFRLNGPLNLSNNKLKTLPDSFFNMSVHSIDISYNDLETLPEYTQSGSLNGCVCLDMNHNKLTQLPESFRKFISLKSIDLSDNTFAIFPAQICSIKALTRINLKNNTIMSITDEIANLEYLELLNLRNNKLLVLPNAIGNLSNLKILDLTNNELVSLPLGITALWGLKSLTLSGNRLRLLPKFNSQTHKFEKIYYTDAILDPSQQLSVEDRAEISEFLTWLVNYNVSFGKEYTPIDSSSGSQSVSSPDRNYFLYYLKYFDLFQATLPAAILPRELSLLINSFIDTDESTIELSSVLPLD